MPTENWKGVESSREAGPEAGSEADRKARPEASSEASREAGPEAGSEAVPVAGPEAVTEQRLAERAAQAMLDRDQASAHLGMTLLQVKPGYARMRMVVAETMTNGHGTCHGGYLFTLADSAFAVACNSYNHVAVAASAQIDFLAPAQLGDVLIAEGRMLSQRRLTGLYDVLVQHEDGRPLAQFRGRSHRLGFLHVHDGSPDSDAAAGISESRSPG